MARESGMAKGKPRLAPLFAENRHRSCPVFGRVEYVPKAVPGGGVRAFGPDTSICDPTTSSRLGNNELTWQRFYEVIEYYYLRELEGNL